MTKELIFLAVEQNDFDLISNLPVFEIPFHEPIVDLGIRNVDHCFQNYVARQQKLLLVVDEFQHTISIGEIVQSDALSEHVLPDAPHLNCISGEKSASVYESWSLEGNWIISFVHNEHSSNFLISIYDEITSELETILLLLGEFLL